jgi:prefoldin subunit 5
VVKKKKSEGETVSLFPFLSILACVIGVLTLMITAMALSQMDQQDDSWKRVEDYEENQEQITAKQEELEQVQSQVEDLSKLNRELMLALEELKKLKQEKQKIPSDIKPEEKVKLLAEANRLEKRITEIKDDPKKLQEEIDKLKKELNKRENPVAAEVRIQPGGSGVDLNPTFVECTKNGIVVLDGPSKDLHVRRDDLRKSLPFVELLDKIGAQNKGTVIFLIRQDAVYTYNIASSVARSRYCPNGKLPVEGNGKIDLSKFKNSSG